MAFADEAQIATPKHFGLSVDGAVATVTLDRPDRKNPLTFESYAELRDVFRALVYRRELKAVVLTGAGGNFCSGGDVHEIIAPLTGMDMSDLLDFTRMTGDLVKAIRACPQAVIAAVDGVCVGAGAILAMASDLRLATPQAKTAFLFTRVGLAGCDMGACAILPRIIGQGRAAELLFTGRSMTAEEGAAWGFYNRLVDAAELLPAATEWARGLAAGPSFAHMMTKTMLNQEWSMSVEAAIESEAQAQAICMQTEDFRIAYRAFAAKAKPVFVGPAEPVGDLTYLDWPFLDDAHRELAAALRAYAPTLHALAEGEDDVDETCRALVRRLGADGWLRLCVPQAHGGRSPELDVRALCLAREALAQAGGLADFAFAMQGLGSGAISLFGDEATKARWLPKVARGEAIAAFALSEPEAGSDVAAMTTSARREGEDYVLDGAKTWISNGGIADFYVVFARTGRLDAGEAGSKGVSAFVVEADNPGLRIAERIALIAPHPLATLAFEGCRVPAASRLGEEGQGFRIAMSTLDVFRPTVGAAALGFARRAMDEALNRARTRQLFGAPMAALQLVQGQIADMALAVDAAALQVFRAAWTKDVVGGRITREAAMAKYVATEGAQQVIDAAVQIMGGLGVTAGQPVERLYREIRALRIYEGASEVQKVIIAGRTLAAADG